MNDSKALGISPFGPASFAKASVVEPDGEWSADIGVLGVPFDQGAGFRAGARWGPRAIRDMSVRFSSLTAKGKPGYWDLRSGKDRATCSIADCGDVEIVPLLWEQNFDRITAAVRHIRQRGALPFVMGGDHSITFPVLRAFEGAKPITVVQFDAHLDYRDEAMGVRYGHGNVLRRVRELAWVERVVAIGIRSLRTRREDHEASLRDGNAILPAYEIHARGPDAFASALPRDKDVYVTFDIDGMDASLAPGTGTPEVGGLSYEQARRFLELVCTRNNLVGFDLVEVNPSFDSGQITGLLSAQLMIEAMGFVFARADGSAPR
ncbi:MAG: agmatinase [Alphaproteobacteria bacterium]